MTEREKWFCDRVGKLVYRGHNGCDCGICENVREKGLTIEDDLYAICAYDFEASCHSPEGRNYFAKKGVPPVKYFDTKEEVAEYEKNFKHEE